MPHEVTLISTVAAALGLALLLGIVAAKLKLPPLVGYLVAGIVIGPATPGFVADVAISAQLAEIGVMLLMFGVGLHFSLKDLLSVRKIALPGAALQMAAATVLGAGLALAWGWGMAGALVFGLALSVASTVVLLKALEDIGALYSGNGRIAVGWLVVEDLAMVLVLVMLPPLAAALTGSGAHSAGEVAGTLATTLLMVAVFVAIMLVAGKRILPWLLWQVARTHSRELFTLAVAAAAVSIAFAAGKLFGVSYALGAFFAGMVMRESALSHRAAEESLPLRDAFAVLFFVSVGMLFDPKVLIDTPLAVLAVVAIILVGKTLAAALLVLAFGHSVRTALTVSASLAQIGEFSFILAGLGVSLKVLPVEGQSLILAGALISIAANPLMFKLIGPVHAALAKRSRWVRERDAQVDPLAELPMTTDQSHLAGQVVIVGYGSIGRRIAHALKADGIRFVVAEQDRARVERLREQGIPAVSGDASQASVLIQAHIAQAAALVIATPDTLKVRPMVEVARALNPGIAIAIRATDGSEAALLARDNAGKVFLASHTLAEALARYAADEARKRASSAH